MRKQKGFSLIELLIVVAIILIIAAIAIPNLLRSRMAANESAAASTIRTLNTAQVSFSTTYASVGYADSLQSLGPNGTACTPATTGPTSACLIDSVLGCATATCIKGAYKYSMAPATVAGADYFASAYPVSAAGGQKRFCSLTDAVIKADKPADPTQPPALADCTPPNGTMTALSN